MRGTLAFITALLASPAAHAVRPPAPDPTQGDGGVSAFYTWQDDIPDKPGQVLRQEPLDSELGLVNAGQQLRILYSSTDGIGGKAPVAVSGAVFLPEGTPPAGGWPLVAWAHGTTGVADVCAPSWRARSSYENFYEAVALSTWLTAGYAVVATDYQGLGTPGPHPYLATRPEAYSVLDSVRAALRAFPTQLANRIVLAGFSQGAGAAFASAGLSREYAPELGVKGAVVIGVPHVNAATFMNRPPRDPNRPDPTLAYFLYLALFSMRIDPALTEERVFSARALPLLAEARTTCVYSLMSDVLAAGLSRAAAHGPDWAAMYPPLRPYLEYPTLKLPAPLFVGTGGRDADVPPPIQAALVHDACAAGTTVEAHLYTRRNHADAVNASLPDALTFARKVLGDEPIRPVCDPAPQ